MLTVPWIFYITENGALVVKVCEVCTKNAQLKSTTTLF
jgi:hypothetical protein